MREVDLEQLYTRLEQPLYNVVFRWVWNAEEAQDVVQDAFVRLWRMRERVETETVEALVYKIALNLAASRGRSKKIWRWVSLDALRGTAGDARHGDDTLTAGEERARVRAAVEELPHDLRAVILLCEYSELSYEEIARVLAVPVGTVGSRRHRALKRLRRALSPEEPDERAARNTV
ncbi:MAG: RNA polymerase sigma factor [bacterium]|nr:RNA polymerase sigma factor [bacterium]